MIIGKYIGPKMPGENKHQNYSTFNMHRDLSNNQIESLPDDLFAKASGLQEL